MSRVLVTGASGFVGRAALAALRGAGDDVHAVVRQLPVGRPLQDEGVEWHASDLLDATSLDRLVAEVRADRLLHLAWYVTHGRFWSAPENVDWVEASLRLLRAFGAAGGRRAVLVGTCAEYEWGGQSNLDEQASPLRPQTLYGVGKDAVRRVASAYASQIGVELGWGRLFFLYGPGEDAARLIPTVVRGLLAGQRVPTTAGAQVRDFMHVEDVARALVTLLDSDVTGPVNIASGRAVSVAEILKLIGALTGRPQLIDRGARPTPEFEPARIVARVQRLTDEVGFRQEISLRDGLASTIEWWRERLETASVGR